MIAKGEERELFERRGDKKEKRGRGEEERIPVWCGET